jgi:hypothetical protein
MSSSKGAIPIENRLSITRFGDFGGFPNPVSLCMVERSNPVKVLHELCKVSKVDNWGIHGGAKT